MNSKTLKFYATKINKLFFVDKNPRILVTFNLNKKNVFKLNYHINYIIKLINM